MLFRFLWITLCLPLVSSHTRREILCRADFPEAGIKDDPTPYLNSAFRTAQEKLDRREAFEKQLDYDGLLIDPRIHSADARHYEIMYEFPKANQMDKMQRLFEGATQYLQERMHLTPDQVQFGINGAILGFSSTGELNQTIIECNAMKEVNCNQSSVYRSVNGSCNNLKIPTRGQTFSCYRRLLPANYADGISVPRNSVTGGPLPNPRILSLTLHSDVNIEAKNYTNMVTQFGEFLSHGLIRTPMKRTENQTMIQCCPENGPQHHSECLPIKIPSNDPFYSQFGYTCMNFVRSTTCADCAFGPRNQTNQLSSYIDASQIYGSDDDTFRKLRRSGSNNKGLLAFIFNEKGGVLLPQSDNPEKDQCSILKENRLCFEAGDTRANQHPGLTAMHTLWLQQHNSIATRLSELNPTWTDEKLFQETRRIIGAQLQMIAYNGYLPVVLGPDLMEQYNLKVTPSSEKFAGRTAYDETVDSTIITEFSTAAYRFGHSLIRNEFKLTFATGTTTQIKLKDYFFFPFIMYKGDEIPLMRGLSSQPAMKFDSHVVHAVSNFVYRVNGNNTSGKDLPALNIQRGRDHGLRGYTEYLNFCLNQNVESFMDLARTGLMEPQVHRRFLGVYKSVHDIDLFSGGLSETAIPGAAVGPTFGHIIALQFHNLKFGDRFYFEHNDQTGSFTDDQLAQIKRTTLAGILCANSRKSAGSIDNRITFLQKNVFRPTSPDNPLVPCFAQPDINLQPWEEIIRPKSK